MGRVAPSDRVVGMAAHAGGGYWLATARGAVLAFGRSPELGDAQGAGRNVLGIAAAPSSDGYWLTASQALARDTPLTITGIGPVVAGMDVREAEQVAGVPFVTDDFDVFDGYCYGAHVEGLDFSFLALSPGDEPVTDPRDGMLGRVSLYGPSSNRLENGLGVASSEADVYRAYPGRVVTEGSTSVEGGHDLTVDEGAFGVRFETDGSRATPSTSVMPG